MRYTDNTVRGTILSAVAILTTLGGCSVDISVDGTADRFHALLDEHWARSVDERIYFRSDGDAWRMNGRLSEHTADARARRNAFNDLMLERLADIQPDELDEKDRISYKVFKYERETERRSFSQFDHYFPIASMIGYHSYFMDAPGNMSFLEPGDYDNYLISLADFPRYNNEFIENMREGMAVGFTQYCESMQNYEKTISVHLVDDASDSELYRPFQTFPATMNADQRADYVAKGSALISDAVVPAYATLLDFFSNEYMPACRQSPGITSVAGGDTYYQYLINFFTTTNMTPLEIHELGKSEVARIQTEMQGIIEKVGFAGDFKAFLTWLREEPSFYAKTENELLGQAALISKTAEGAAPRFFTLLPRGTYKIAGNPNRGSYYVPSSGDGTTSGTYFVGTEDLKSQPLYSLEALTLHEGVPGHHLQSALAMELGLPEFRRPLYHAAYGEGWGLYSERLGKEMGFYTSPYSDFGRLTYEAWRACRLVVDTGMHAFGWSRQQALDYMLANTAVSELSAKREIDRYITWPAQALAYKIGELKIRELRSTAEVELGADFDLRHFHDVVVGNGSVPIAVLEEIVADWIVQEKQMKQTKKAGS